MDQGLKERLIGAAVLVALAVWLVPLLLDGPDEAAGAPESALKLPVPQREAPRLKTEVIDLDTPSAPPSPAVARPSGASGAGRPAAQARASRNEDAAAATARKGGAAAPAAKNADEVLSGSSPAASPSSSSRKPVSPADSPSRTASADASTRARSQSAPPPAKLSEPPAKPSEPPAKSSPPPASASAAKPLPALADTAQGGDWAVQLGSFGEQENAQRLAGRVADYGADARISKYKADRRIMYRVRVGPYGTRDAAEAAASSLSVHGFVAQVVTVH